MRFSRNVSNQVGSALNYKDGKAKFTVQWEQPKPGGCIYTRAEPCTEKKHCWLCYLLLIFLLAMVCCATRGAVRRKHAIIKDPVPVNLRVSVYACAA